MMHSTHELHAQPHVQVSSSGLARGPIMPLAQEHAEEWILGPSPRMTNLATVIPGLVPGIQRAASAGVCGAMDPGNKCRDDIVFASMERCS